jgi:hypothetical protein
MTDTNHADVLQATYSDIKIIKTRKVLQISVEVPLEHFDLAMMVLGGAPMPDKETWLGIVRLDKAVVSQPPPEHKAEEKAASPPAPQTDPAPAHRTKKAWGEMPATQRAVLRCEDHRFRSWLTAIGRIDHSTEEATLAYVRRIAQGSRSNLGKSGFEKETEAWNAVDRAYAKYLDKQTIDSMR